MGGCTSDPTSGCDNGDVLVAINESNTQIITELNNQDDKLDDILTAFGECCATLTAKLDQILALQNIINDKL